VEVRVVNPADIPAHQTEWMERCRARIAEQDPSLDPRDVLELAVALAERPSCRAVPPERAADLLFSGKLNFAAIGRR
jgi:hypothetical protein